jgi:hypothetical protein
VYLHDANVKGTFGAGSKARGVLGGACGLEGEPSRPTGRRDAFPDANAPHCRWHNQSKAASGTLAGLTRLVPWLPKDFHRDGPKITMVRKRTDRTMATPNHQSPAPMTRTLIEILSLDRRHLILKRTGTIKDNWSSGTSLGGAGIG